MAVERIAHRGRIAHCLQDPSSSPEADAVEYFADGLLLLVGGHVAELGPADVLLDKLGADVRVVDHDKRLLLPGLIDCHVHYAQLDVVASYGEQLLDWLRDYTFPAERRFADIEVANAAADFFLDELLKHGTTSALVFATVHPQSVDAIFTAAVARNMRITAGKVLMDRHCPADLQDTVVSGYEDSRVLLQRWHGTQRLGYAITPRFAGTSSPEQLLAAGRLAAEFPDVLVHTHLAENIDEVRWVEALFPAARSYLDVYKQSGLLREPSLFAHCVHLNAQDFTELAANGGAIAFCPTSNLFLGSGGFDLAAAQHAGITVGLGTDVGAGTSLSLLRTLGEGYKVLQTQRQNLSSFSGLYLATLGAAQALSIADKVGNFAVGKEADFIVLDNAPNALLARRLRGCADLADELFVQMTLGDDRSIAATYVLGERAYANNAGVAR